MTALRHEVPWPEDDDALVYAVAFGGEYCDAGRHKIEKGVGYATDGNSTICWACHRKKEAK